MTGAASRASRASRAAAHYERAETYASNGQAEKARAHFGRASKYAKPSFHFDERAEANVASLTRLRGDRGDYRDVQHRFVLESVNGAPLEIYLWRTARYDAYVCFLQYGEAPGSVNLDVVVARAGNKVDVADAMQTNEQPEQAVIETIHTNGAVMVRRFVKHDEAATEADVLRTRGLGMRLLGTLLAFLMRIGMCKVDTGVYAYLRTGGYDGTRREAFLSERCRGVNEST